MYGASTVRRSFYKASCDTEGGKSHCCGVGKTSFIGREVEEKGGVAWCDDCDVCGPSKTQRWICCTSSSSLSLPTLLYKFCFILESSRRSPNSYGAKLAKCSKLSKVHIVTRHRRPSKLLVFFASPDCGVQPSSFDVFGASTTQLSLSQTHTHTTSSSYYCTHTVPSQQRTALLSLLLFRFCDNTFVWLVCAVTRS